MTKANILNLTAFFYLKKKKSNLISLFERIEFVFSFGGELKGSKRPVHSTNYSVDRER